MPGLKLKVFDDEDSLARAAEDLINAALARSISNSNIKQGSSASKTKQMQRDSFF